MCPGAYFFEPVLLKFRCVEKRIGAVFYFVWTQTTVKASCPSDYPHSSALFYITGQQGIYPVTSYTFMEDIDLTK